MQLSQEAGSSSRSTATPHVPFCTPRKDGCADASQAYAEPPQPTTFTAAEVERFQACFLESTDLRYALWLEAFCPQSRAKVLPEVLEAILQRPPPPAKQKAHKYPLDCGRVLTSEQCTVDSPSKGQLGTIAFVLCMEVSLTWKVLLEYHTSINLTFNTKHYNNESATIKKITIYNE